VTAGAEAALAAPSPFQPEELQWILDRMPSGIVVVDRDVVVRYFNATAQRLFEPECLRVGSRMPDLRTEERLADVLARVFGDGAVTGHQLRREGGETYVVDGVTTERRARVILRLDDVTAQAQRMQAGHDFIVNAAHEFLSPLTAIAGAAHVLQDGAKDVPGVRDRFVSHTVEGSNRLISLSRALLVLARAEAGVEPPRLELVPLRPLLEGVAAAERDGVKVRCADDAAALADADLLREVLANLVQNAKRHGQSDVEVIADVDGDTIGIDVVNRGSPIPPEYLSSATQRFFSGNGRDGGGFGVGLSIAARAAEVLGGALELESDGDATRVRVQLPAARLIIP
jgi:two-component system, OmpR family, phosphate regulon sensor histidine kinase PhoR